MAVTGFWPVFKNLKATLDYADNPDKTTCQVIIGTKVQFVYDELKKML